MARKARTAGEPLSSRSALSRVSIASLVSAGAVESRPEADAILLPIGSQAAGVLGLEQGEAILEGVEVRLADEGPARLVIRLRVGLLVIAVHEREGQLPRPGPDRRRVPQVVDDIGLAERLGEEGIQQAEGLALDGRLRRPGPGVPELHGAVLSPVASRVPSGLKATP